MSEDVYPVPFTIVQTTSIPNDILADHSQNCYSAKMNKTVGMISLGCPKNLVDSEIMLGLLEKAGYRIVTNPKDAMVLIVNTCSFIEDAKRESIEAVLEMAHYKDKGRAKYLVIAGCLPQKYKGELSKLFPEVDLFIGTGEYQRIVKLVENLAHKNTRTPEHQHTRTPQLHIGVPEYIHSAATPRKISGAAHAVYIKVAEGCFHNCSFCSIPRIRGKFRSRSLKDVVAEAKSLITSGAKELNLIAQDTTAYGRDFHDGTNLTKLLAELAGISGEKWIRFLYAYPQTFRRDTLKLMSETPDICKYIDIPIQHIDNDILLNMRRGRSEGKIRSLVECARRAMPDIALRTSLIVGFPGETEKQFKKLLKFVGEGHFDHLGVFTYSEEEGTKAAGMARQVPERVKKERQKEILMFQKKISRKKLKAKVGKRIKVLVEGPSAETEHLLQARAEFQAPDIDGVVYINDGKAKAGEFYWVEITESYDYDLLGKVV